MRGVWPFLVVVLLAGAAGAAEFRLEARQHDTVMVRGLDKAKVGTIEKEDDNLLQFRTLRGIRHTWPKSQVVSILRKCTLREAYRQANKKAGKDPREHLRLYQACLDANLKKEAWAELRQAISLDPKYMPAYLKLLEEARATNNVDLELATLQSAARARVATVPMLLRIAQIHVVLGMVDNAEEPLRKALLVDPFNADAESRLAMLELARGRADRAQVHVDRMLKRDAKSPEALTASGLLALAHGNQERAAEAFNQALARSKSPVAATCLGALTLRANRSIEAGRHYAQARALRPGFAPALTGEGLVAARSGDLKTAAARLDRAVALSPRRADILTARAYVAELAGKQAAALALHQKTLELDRANADAMAGAARCHWALGDAAKAKALFEQALSIRPGFLPALRGMGRLALARTPSAAATCFRQVVASKGATSADRAALACALIRLQRFGEAAAELTRAGNGNVHGRIGLGFLAYNQGRRDEAIDHFEAAVKLGDYQGYAAAAIRRIREAESRLAWSDRFERPDDPLVRNNWTEVEPEGLVISVKGNVLLFEGKPAADGLSARLVRDEEADFVSITAEAQTGTEADSFIGVFVAKRGEFAKSRVLLGRHGTGKAAVFHPGLAAPRLLGRAIPQGRFTLTIALVNKAKGTVRFFVNGRRVAGLRNVTVPELAGATAYEVGLFASPTKGRAVNCQFHFAKLVRSK